MVGTALARRLFTVAEFERLIEVNFWEEDERIELIEGEFVDLGPIGIRHMEGINALTHRAVELVGHEATVSVQNAIRLSGRSRPQPDLALLKLDPIRRALPTAADIFLVLKIADSTLPSARTVKPASLCGGGHRGVVAGQSARRHDRAPLGAAPGRLHRHRHWPPGPDARLECPAQHHDCGR